MAKYRITYDRDACIGAAACEDLDPLRFKVSEDDGKANLTGGKEEKPGLFILDVDDITDTIEAAKACPVQVIKIKDLETGKDIV